MCSVAGLLIGALGVGLQTMSAYRQTEAENQAADYNAAVAKQNAAISEQNALVEEERAKAALARGEVEEKQHRLSVAKTLGSQRSALAGSGVVVDSGSGMDAQMDTVKFGELDALDIRHNAEMEAWGYKVEAVNARNTSRIYDQQANFYKSRKTSPLLSAGTTLLSGVTSLDKQTGFLTSLF